MWPHYISKISRWSKSVLIWKETSNVVLKTRDMKLRTSWNSSQKYCVCLKGEKDWDGRRLRYVPGWIQIGPTSAWGRLDMMTTDNTHSTLFLFSDSVFVWYMWLIYGISGCVGGSVVIYLSYKFIAAKIMNHLFSSDQAAHNTLTHPKLSFPKRKIFSTNQNRIK